MDIFLDVVFCSALGSIWDFILDIILDHFVTQTLQNDSTTREIQLNADFGCLECASKWSSGLTCSTHFVYFWGQAENCENTN